MTDEEVNEAKPEEELDEDEFEIPKVVRQKIEALLPEIVRKTLQNGVDAVFSTEDGIRKYAKDMKLPKEVASYVSSTAGATKDEVVRRVGGEVREFLENMNMADEIAKILTTLSFEIKTEVRFIPNDEKLGKVQPDVRARAKVKRARRTTGGFLKRKTEEVNDNEEPQDPKEPN